MSDASSENARTRAHFRLELMFIGSYCEFMHHKRDRMSLDNVKYVLCHNQFNTWIFYHPPSVPWLIQYLNSLPYSQILEKHRVLHTHTTWADLICRIYKPFYHPHIQCHCISSTASYTEYNSRQWVL